MPIKQCSKCEQNKELSEFYKYKNNKDGFSYQCKICDDLKSKKYRKSLKGKTNQAKAKKNWHQSEKGKKIQAESNKRFWKSPEGKARKLASESKRRANKLRATPPWLTQQHYSEIRDYFKLAKEIQWLSEEPLHVDHIIPLQGENICGLHVPWNLQILPRSKNCSKYNKLI